MKNREKFITLFNLIKDKKILNKLNIKNTNDLFKLTDEELDSIILEKDSNKIIMKINLYLSDLFKDFSFLEKIYFTNIIIEHNFNLSAFNKLINIYDTNSLKQILDFILSNKNKRRIEYTINVLKNPRIIDFVYGGVITKEELENFINILISEKKVCNTVIYSRFLTNKALLKLLEKNKINITEIFEILKELEKYDLISKALFVERIIQRPKIITLFLSDKNYREFIKKMIIDLNNGEEYKARYISNITKNKFILKKIEKKEIDKSVFTDLIESLLKIEEEEQLKEVLEKSKEINNENTKEKIKEMFLISNRENKNNFVKKRK